VGRPAYAGARRVEDLYLNEDEALGSFDMEESLSKRAVRSGLRESEPGFRIIDHISFGGRRFNLREPMHVTVSMDHGLWEYHADEFGIESFGPSKDAAEASFFEDFSVVYDQIAQESDERLTSEAIALKRALLGLVESVVVIA